MTKKKGNNWTAYYDSDTHRYFAEIIYTSREGREQYNYEITREIFDKLGTFNEDYENELLIRTAKMTYSFENTHFVDLLVNRCSYPETCEEYAYDQHK